LCVYGSTASASGKGRRVGLGSATTLYGTVALSFVIPRKPRDLQFRGPVLETRNTILKQKCHLACPGVPWDRTRISCHAALDIAACAAFVKESSIKCANATKFHRKSGL